MLFQQQDQGLEGNLEDIKEIEKLEEIANLDGIERLSFQAGRRLDLVRLTK